MKPIQKKLTQFYDYLKSPASLQVLAVGLVGLVVLSSLAWSAPLQLSTPTPSAIRPTTTADQSKAPVILTPIPTPTSPSSLIMEYLANRDQTLGIAYLGVLLVVIIIGGTYSVIRNKPVDSGKHSR